MTGMELFIPEPELTFQKLAGVQLDEDPLSWPRQVLTELYREIPEISEFTPQVMFTKVNKEQGYGLGVVVVTSATDSALAALRPGSPAKKIFVPVVVKNHELSPLDIFMTRGGRFFPLLPHRVREALFRPEIFDMVTDDFGDTTLYNMFYPPGRSDNSFGAGISQGVDGGTAGAVTFIQGPGMKLSSKLSSGGFDMICAVLPTLSEQDVRRVAQIVESDPALFKAASTNLTFLAALQHLAERERMESPGVEDLIKSAVDMSPTHVVQMGFSLVHDAYWVKTASRSAFYHREPVMMSRGEFLKFAGPEATMKVDTEGVVTVSTVGEEAAALSPDTSKWAVVKEPGIYKVRTVSGKEITGWVLPNLLDFDGTVVPMAVFTNGVAAMVQDQIAGARVATGVDLPSSKPKGTGVFYMAGPSGIEATVPVEVVGSEAEMGGGDSYLVKTITGGEHKIRLVPGLKKMVSSSEEIMVPDTVKFLSLDDEMMVQLVEHPDQLTKTAAYLMRPQIVLYGGDGEEFGVRFQNMPKLASVFPRQQDYETAVFALCLAGLDAPTAHSKLAAASRGDTVTVDGVKDIRLASDLVGEARKTASEEAQAVTALRRYLIKEAAVLPDVMTVDTILSLGFINPENVRMYISRIPYLERALSMICELLLGSRVGLTEIPEGAAARAARGLDSVIQGLKALALREVEEGSGTGG